MNDDKLMQAAGQLSKAIRPEHDLWPGIADAIAKPEPRRWTPMLAQAAAVVLLVGASSGITYFTMKEEPVVIERFGPGLQFEQTAFGAEQTLSSVYRSAQGDYQTELNKELDRLSPEVRADIENNLALIKAAIAQINLALEENPDNVLLQDLLVKSYREQHTLLRRVGALAKHVMVRKDI
jgi:hypothetical protein